MYKNLSEVQISKVFSRALQEGELIGSQDTAVIFYDLSFLEKRIQNLIELFPNTTLHALAVKANPLHNVLTKVRALGVGAEAATLPELHIAIEAGFTPDKIVFGSPTKTKQELAFALNLGVHINADSLADLDKIDSALGSGKPKGTIGVRINPQVGTGKILSTSVAGEYSKFGVPIKEYREELIERFLAHDWLSGVHIHIGSQGISLEQLINGLDRVMGFVRQTNRLLSEKGSRKIINVVDIGGGVPISYNRNAAPLNMTQYRDEILKKFPELFSDEYKMITEFGRYIHTNPGWVVSRVESVKRDREINTAMVHVGADLFLRECYNPNDWSHEITVLDAEGNVKTGKDNNNYMIAGPLCFAGDLITRNIALPRVDEGDYIDIHDAGAYTLGMWSRYNSRQVPKVIGYYNDGHKFEIIKERESIEKILSFWK